ncbi:M42 family metallopeptidase [Sediminispirochaeta smaragdinae]|jgi:putative aminopeptidase FrvX|uniref:Peptidase M42 family protein n=1 Tax=Sediminispirochaeta smaragdinae (strain DSM 11293 / JCM 15392 / SEBR 4228) TaxID=573413 RepID=E1RCQ4_SEDSS|nr:M42 family metallopeptidase [Sediminispirochaeta smaragdinae]ADK80134.1 peptidase M42 family protein [Sediminispirochaeta smaragdinae DSM 11293]
MSYSYRDAAVLKTILERLKYLCAFPSPTGFAEPLADELEKRLSAAGFVCERMHKGELLCHLGGEGRPLVYSAHLDTLGAMVRTIKSNGRLRFAKIGSYPDHSVERENCVVHTASGLSYSGTVQFFNPSVHASKDASEAKRSDENLEIVLDQCVDSDTQCRELGIAPGDWISFDPRTVITETGFIKSRHLDDKAAVAVLLALSDAAADGSFQPKRRLSLFFSLHEEVGHGGATGFGSDVGEFIAVDMGVVGEDLSGSDTTISICAMDSRGPFDRKILRGLTAAAHSLNVDFALDVYPFYGSDADAALFAGNDLRHGLIGPGVSASHGYERTHCRALDDLFAVLKHYAEID